jgi:hypothetical protein
MVGPTTRHVPKNYHGQRIGKEPQCCGRLYYSMGTHQRRMSLSGTQRQSTDAKDGEVVYSSIVVYLTPLMYILGACIPLCIQCDGRSPQHGS